VSEGWRPVTEHPPPDLAYGLICVVRPGHRPSVRVGYWRPIAQKWRYSGLLRIPEKDRVTHWMPWPAPPKEIDHV